MTNFEKIKNMDKEDLARWLNENIDYCDGPWSKWFDKKYCNNCKKVKDSGGITYSYCELERKCRFFDEDIYSCFEINKWLEVEVEG